MPTILDQTPPMAMVPLSQTAFERYLLNSSGQATSGVCYRAVGLQTQARLLVAAGAIAVPSRSSFRDRYSCEVLLGPASSIDQRLTVVRSLILIAKHIGFRRVIISPADSGLQESALHELGFRPARGGFAIARRRPRRNRHSFLFLIC